MIRVFGDDFRAFRVLDELNRQKGRPARAVMVVCIGTIDMAVIWVRGYSTGTKIGISSHIFPFLPPFSAPICQPLVRLV